MLDSWLWPDMALPIGLIAKSLSLSMCVYGAGATMDSGQHKAGI